MKAREHHPDKDHRAWKLHWGELWVHDKGKQNVKNIWYKLDGNVPDATYPIERGMRYSLIFYTHKKHAEAITRDVDWLKERREHMLRRQRYKHILSAYELVTRGPSKRGDHPPLASLVMFGGFTIN